MGKETMPHHAHGQKKKEKASFGWLAGGGKKERPTILCTWADVKRRNRPVGPEVIGPDLAWHKWPDLG